MPTPTYTPLATVTLGSSAASVTFSSIPATYRDLVLVVNAKNTVGANYNSLARLNGDTGNNNPSIFMMGNSSGAVGVIRNVDGAGQIGYSNSSSNSTIIAQFMDYSATDKHKTILSRSNAEAERVSAHAIRWTNTAAITSIAVLIEGGATWATGGRFDLYGILA